MLVQTLEEMDLIVDKNDNLDWDGWTVRSLKPVKDGLLSKDGIRIEGKWFLQTRYDITDKGWNIPDKLVSNGQA